MRTQYFGFFAALLLVSLTGLKEAEAAREVSLGTPVNRQDAALTIAAAYEPPVRVEGTDASGRPLFLLPDKADLFLTVDIRAGKGNKNGFGAGEFIPYLSVSYTLQRRNSTRILQGQLHSLVTRQGMRYGNNVRLTGPGTYTLTLTVEPPIKVGFGRHTDLETGVSRWWKPFQIEWTLKYPETPNETRQDHVP